MADRTIKPDDTNDLVLSNNHGDSKIKINEDDTIVMTGASSDFLKSGELNSLGYLSYNFFGASYYLSGSKSCANSTWTEIDATWTKMITSGASGSDDADIFGKFGTSTGRWTPTVSGFYRVSYSVFFPGIDAENSVLGAIRRNGSATAGHYGGYSKSMSPGTNLDIAVSGSTILGLDTNDYVSLYALQNSGDAQDAGTGTTTFSVNFVGVSDL